MSREPSSKDVAIVKFLKSTDWYQDKYVRQMRQARHKDTLHYPRTLRKLMHWAKTVALIMGVEARHPVSGAPMTLTAQGVGAFLKGWSAQWVKMAQRCGAFILAPANKERVSEIKERRGKEMVGMSALFEAIFPARDVSEPAGSQSEGESQEPEQSEFPSDDEADVDK